MMRDIIILSLDEAETLLGLIGYKSIEELKKLTAKELNLLNEFRLLVRNDPIGDHIAAYHSD